LRSTKLWKTISIISCIVLILSLISLYLIYNNYYDYSWVSDYGKIMKVIVSFFQTLFIFSTLIYIYLKKYKNT
jgi:uncharacterized membrane protein